MLLQELALSLRSQRQNEAGRCSCSGSDDLSASPKPKMVLGPCWYWLCVDWPEQGYSYSREGDSPCINKSVSSGQFSVVFPFQCSERIEKSCLLIPPALLDIRVGRE